MKLPMISSTGCLRTSAKSSGAHATPEQGPRPPVISTNQVTALLEDRGITRTIETDDQGSYVFPSMPVGMYDVRVEATGFKTSSRSGVELSANENARVDATLEVGNLSQSVSVVAEAPLVDSRSSIVETLIDSRRVAELPINGRQDGRGGLFYVVDQLQVFESIQALVEGNTAPTQ